MIEYWEKFKAGPTKPIGERLHVTINHRGIILLNRNAHKLLGSPRAVVLFFNKANSMIGLSPAHHQLAEAFPVIPQQGGGCRIQASPFCRHFGIKPARTEAFVAPDIDPEGVLRLDLSTTVSVSGQPRGKGQKSPV